jgi:catechol 2,3-dioxygenase-like lactoylglutathione lyase family enzyme
VSAIGSNNSAITLFVTDIDAAKAFYQGLLERDPIFTDDVSAAFRLDHVIINLLAVTEAPELVEPAAVATPVTVTSLMTLAVADCDAACAALAAKGIEILNGPIDRPWGVRTAAFQDPDGHAWELAQEIGQSQAAAPDPAAGSGQ